MADYAARFDALKRRNSERDARMRDLSLVRVGEARQVFEGLFPDRTWSKPIVANMIDVVANDFAEQTGVLPTITALGDSSLDATSRTNADKRTKIANYFVAKSNLGKENIRAAQQFASFGFTVYRVEPNFKDRRPHIHVEPATGSYWDMDRFGDVRVYAHTYQRRAGELAALFPEYASQLLGSNSMSAGDGSQILEIVRWYDTDNSVLFVPARSGLILAKVPNRLGRVPVSIAIRPTFDGEIRGQFDEVLPVYAAKAKLAILTMMAVQKSVEAPLALPNDVNRLPIGPDALIRTNSPEKIRRVPLEVPQYAFAENNNLGEELKLGARYPEGRAGQIEASVVTGQGVKALNAGFDGQVKIAQSILGDAMGEAVSLALEMDEVYFGNVRKDIVTSSNGSQYTLSYTASKDIKGRYGVNVEFGLMAGLDPNRALVYALQARGDKLLSRQFVRRNLPFSINANEEERAIDMEEMRDSLKAGFNSMAAAIPQMAMQGQDPSEIVRRMALVIDQRKRGTELEDAIGKAFEPPKAPQTPDSAGQPPAGPGATSGLDESLTGPVENQTMQEAPPPMQQLLAGLTGSGKPVLAGRVVRQVPTQ